MIFISFGASAYKGDINTMYKSCSVFKKNNFQYKGLNDMDLFSVVLCESVMQSYAQIGYNNCENLHIANEAAKNNLKEDHWKTKVFLDGLAENTANANVNTTQAILSFLNYAEKNPNLFNKLIIFQRSEFLSKVFPCDLNKPIMTKSE
jgi:hypothetical protein